MRSACARASDERAAHWLRGASCRRISRRCWQLLRACNRCDRDAAHDVWPQWPGRRRRARASLRCAAAASSLAPYASLNLGAHVGDAPQAVAQNRRALRQQLALPPSRCGSQQVHGTAGASTLTGVPARGAVAAARAMRAITRAGRARCWRCWWPIACRCCWRRATAARLASRTPAGAAWPPAYWRRRWRRWRGHGPLQAWLGPAIGPAHFEVGDEVRAAFLAHDPAAAAAFTCQRARPLAVRSAAAGARSGCRRSASTRSMPMQAAAIARAAALLFLPARRRDRTHGGADLAGKRRQC